LGALSSLNFFANRNWPSQDQAEKENISPTLLISLMTNTNCRYLRLGEEEMLEDNPQVKTRDLL
jgi:hypothetical protein